MTFCIDERNISKTRLEMISGTQANQSSIYNFAISMDLMQEANKKRFHQTQDLWARGWNLSIDRKKFRRVINSPMSFASNLLRVRYRMHIVNFTARLLCAINSIGNVYDILDDASLGGFFRIYEFLL